MNTFPSKNSVEGSSIYHTPSFHNVTQDGDNKLPQLTSHENIMWSTKTKKAVPKKRPRDSDPI